MTRFTNLLHYRRAGTVGTTFTAMSAIAAVVVLFTAPADLSAATLDDVPYTTPMWSAADPFALGYLASRTQAWDTAVLIAGEGYLEGIMAALAPAALNAGMSNYLAAASVVASNAQEVAGIAYLLAASATNVTSQAMIALAGQSNLTDSAISAASNAQDQALSAYIAGTNAASLASVAYVAGTNAAALAGSLSSLAGSAYAAGTNGQAVAYEAGSNAASALVSSALAYTAATNAVAYSYAASTNAASAVVVYAIATNAQGIAGTSLTTAQSAAAAAGVALTLAGSYYAIATNAAAQASAVYAVSTNALAVSSAAMALAAAAVDEERLMGYTGVSTNLVWMDVTGLPGSVVTAALWRAATPTSALWRVVVPYVTNSYLNPLAQTGMETQWWDTILPVDLPWPSDGPVAWTKYSSGGALLTFVALTNVTGGVDIFHGSSRSSSYLASASASESAYLAGGPFEFTWLQEGLTGTVALAKVVPAATTNQEAVVATVEWAAAEINRAHLTAQNNVMYQIWNEIGDPFFDFVNAVSNNVLRVYDSGGGAFKILLPGEEAP